MQTRNSTYNIYKLCHFACLGVLKWKWVTLWCVLFRFINNSIIFWLIQLCIYHYIVLSKFCFLLVTISCSFHSGNYDTNYVKMIKFKTYTIQYKITYCCWIYFIDILLECQEPHIWLQMQNIRLDWIWRNYCRRTFYFKWPKGWGSPCSSWA